MAIQQVSAKTTSGDRGGDVYTVNKDLPESLKEAVEMYGEEIVFSNVMSSITIALQGYMRTQIKKDNATPESIQLAIDGWKPGIKVRGRTPLEKAQAILSSLSAEDRAELLADLA
jgi:hypothetical protein